MDDLLVSRQLKNDYRAAWLLRAVTCIDLTTLGGDDTPSNVARLCQKVHFAGKEIIASD